MFILTVEDEFLISEYLREILEGGGHEVIATFDADEAIKVLERVGDIQLSLLTSTCRARWTAYG
jgi:CheY-like chemotaxis protein